MRWIADYRFLSDMSLVEGTKELVLKHPQSTYEVTLRVIDDTPGELAAMAAFVVFEAENADEAKMRGRDVAREFLAHLSFVTEAIIKPQGVHRLFEWGESTTDRKGFIFNYFKDTHAPTRVISQSHIASIENIMEMTSSDLVVSAMKWFSDGLKVEDQERQFQDFWSVLELLAPLHRGNLESTIKCPQCRSDLYCNQCKKAPRIRASASEGVKFLVQQMVTNEPDQFFRTINRVRNLLFHTVPINKIEEELDINFEALTEQMARVSRLAITNSIRPIPPSSANVQLEMIEVGGVVHKTLVHKVAIAIASGENTIDLLPDAKTELSSTDRDSGKQGKNVGIHRK